ncbi:D-alanine--D-serine ligase [Listeria sp. PSOL-1]|uniref:D-alanine--D-serine ligase n=1 Tax=Listeria sp. PSOL-1 TaxID=1844999 RepID=UPI0013D83F8B|nr:D-alanine--D-serine ligase [Listeria sp. PSOL-1]
MKKIALIFGGNSSEYEVSLKSAASMLKAMSTLDYEVYKIAISQSGRWYRVKSSPETISKDQWLEDLGTQEVFPYFHGKGFWLKESECFLKPDILFPILHGGTGEDGTLQGIFEMMSIPYVGCGIKASAVCMNKWMLHQFAARINIKSTPTMLITSPNEKKIIEQFVEKIGFPLFVKPNEAGSSKGISQVMGISELSDALVEGFNYGNQVILQKSVVGTEIGCAILGNEELIVGECDEISLIEGFFDYTEKYQLVTAQIKVPATIQTEISDEIKRQAQSLYRLLGCKGLSRIDFFLTEAGEILLNEVNTLPGFTSHSRYPKMLASVGIPYTEIIERLLILAEEAYDEKYISTVS